MSIKKFFKKQYPTYPLLWPLEMINKEPPIEYIHCKRCGKEIPRIGGKVYYCIYCLIEDKEIFNI